MIERSFFAEELNRQSPKGDAPLGQWRRRQRGHVGPENGRAAGRSSTWVHAVPDLLSSLPGVVPGPRSNGTRPTTTTGHETNQKVNIGDVVEAVVVRVVPFGVVLAANEAEILLLGVDTGRDVDHVVEAYPVGSSVRVRITHRGSDGQYRGQAVPVTRPP